MRYPLLAALLALPLASCSGPVKPARQLDSSAQVNIRKGQIYLDDKDYASALACFDEALKEEPANTAALLGRGRAYAGQGNYDQAIADYNAVPEGDPNAGLVYLHRCLAYAEKEEDYTSVVLPELEAAKKHNLGTINADQELAAVYARHGAKYKDATDLPDAFQKAADCYNIAAFLDPNSGHYHYLLALSLDRLQDWTQAITEYDAAKKLGEPAEIVDRALSVAYLSRARAFKAKNQLAEAKADYKQAVKLNPNLQKYDPEFGVTPNDQ
jgi:tetratricopeptide (TPR) repeat protein